MTNICHRCRTPVLLTGKGLGSYVQEFHLRTPHHWLMCPRPPRAARIASVLTQKRPAEGFQCPGLPTSATCIVGCVAGQTATYIGCAFRESSRSMKQRGRISCFERVAHCLGRLTPCHLVQGREICSSELRHLVCVPVTNSGPLRTRHRAL